MPRIQAALLCDAAKVDQSGQVSMLGAFVDTITTAAAPPIRHLVYFACRLYFDDSDLDVEMSLDLRVEAVTMDPGEAVPPGPLVSISGVFMASSNDTMDDRIAGGAPMVIPLMVEYPGTGLFHVTLVINGELIWTAPIVVKRPG